jgi:hypothetical protein
MCTGSHLTLYFLQEQAAEEAVAAAKKEFYDAIVNKCMEDVHEARKRYESAVAALAKFRKVLFESIFIEIITNPFLEL